ncbi:MAG: hypothetical protein H6745_04150 [Deltaproteobacteria bacterium]|nr:hypothetical protein [Deltaproteobacteria bacterium]
MTRLSLVALTMMAFLAACGGDEKAKTDTTVGGDADTVEPADTVPACGGDPGTAGCACRGDGGCDTGLACVANVCQVASEPTGLVLPAGARGCEILLSEGAGAAVSEVRFADSVRGTFIREAPRVAIAVTATSDADFADGAVEVVGTGAPTVTSSTCVDAAGTVLPGASVVLR